MKKALYMAALLLCLLGLVCVRLFESSLFYDPLMVFFKGAYQTANLPSIDESRWFTSLFARYFLNTIFSLGIIWILFKEKGLVTFSLLVYTILFIVLSLAVYIVMKNYVIGGYELLFFLRRLLLQPVLLMVLLPAFVYYRVQKRK